MALFSTLTDRFDDNSLDVAKWAENGDVVEQNQRIQMVVLVPGDSATLSTVNNYDLTSSYALIEIPLISSTSNIEFQFALWNPSTFEQVEFWLNSGALKARSIDGSVGIHYTATYNATLHRWLRIREQSGVIYYDISSDSNAWTNAGSYAHSITINSMQMFCSVSNSAFATRTIYLDNFNLQNIPATASIDGADTITTTPHVTYYMNETITGGDTIEAIGVSLADQRQVEKTYLYKVYDSDDTFLGVWDDVLSDLSFEHELFSAGSSIQVDLGRNSDSRVVQLEDLHTASAESLTTQDGNALVIGIETTNAIGPGSNVDLNYRVEIWVFYGEITDLSTTSGEIILTQGGENIQINHGAVNGLRKFNGYITRYVSRYGGNETVQVSIASFGAELDNYVLESGSNTTVTYSSVDPTAIVRDALDKFTAAGGRVDYDASSTTLAATSVSYTFRVNTYLEVLKKAVELAPYDWYWYVGLGDDLVYFKPKPTSVSHTFVLGKHIQELNVEYTIENITNVVYFTGGPTAGVNLFKKYTDATSISNYRQGLQRITDHRVTLAASATLISEAEIDRNSVPRYRSTVTILESVYDVESISVGQLTTFRNAGNYIDDLELQVMGLSYEPDRVTLQLDSLQPSVNKRVEDLRRALLELDNVESPSAPS